MQTIIQKLRARFDSVPETTLRAIVRETLTEAGQAKRLDGQVRYDTAPARSTRTDGLAALKQAQADAFAGAGQRADTAPEPVQAKRSDGLATLRKAQADRFERGAA